MSQRASSIVVTGPTCSSPCSAPDISRSGRSAFWPSVAWSVTSSTQFMQGAPSQTPADCRPYRSCVDQSLARSGRCFASRCSSATVAP